MQLLLFLCAICLLCCQARSYIKEKRFSSIKVNRPCKQQLFNNQNVRLPTKSSVSQLIAEFKEPATHPKLSYSNAIINIIADLCPHGMMPLSYGIAQGAGTGWIPALALLIIFGSLSTYTMISYANLSKETNSRNISEVWSKLISAKTAWLVDISIFALCFGCCIFYSAFIGDIFAAIAVSVGIKEIYSSRWLVLMVISSVVLLPLCLLEDISALKLSSFVGTLGILYTVLFHLVRYFDGSYAIGSPLLKYVPPKLQPTWSNLNNWNMDSGTLILVNMLCVAFLAHYNSINYFEEFDNPTPIRYNSAISIGFAISMAVFAIMMFVGFRLFGHSAQPLLLNNFPQIQDNLATWARIATGAAITFAYPLMFAGLKSSLFSLISISNNKISPKNNLLSSSNTIPPTNGNSYQHHYHTIEDTILPLSSTQSSSSSTSSLSRPLKISSILAVLTVITAIALQCGEEDVSVVLGIVGSTLGCFTAYILPALLQLVHISKQQNSTNINNNNNSIRNNRSAEIVLNRSIVILGVLFSMMGVWITIKSEIHKTTISAMH